MKTQLRFILATLALVALSTLNPQLSTFAQGTAFTYQGRLQDGANPANGIYDLRFTLYDAPSGGNVAGGPLTNATTSVNNGLFTVTLDFGAGMFTGPARWLEIGVRTNGGGAFTPLLPLQPLTPAPYAITASNLSGTLPTTQLTGAVPDAQLSGNVSLFGSAIDSLEIADGTIVNADISPNAAIADTKLATISTAGKVANSALSNNVSLLGQSIESGEIIDGTITTNDLNASVLNGTFWKLGGNTGANPTNGNFLGTTDNQPLELFVNNTRAVRIETNRNVGIGVSSPASRLHVAGPGDTELSVESATSGGRRWTLQSSHGSPAFGNATFQIIDRTAGASRLNITTNGDIGIGIGNAVPASRLQVNGTVTATSFSGDGSGLTGLSSLNASQLTSGTVPDARLSASVALRNGGNAFSGNQTVTGDSYVSGSVIVDSAGANTGGIFGSPGLVFGDGVSGEGIASKRTAGGNQNGLDFYTSYNARLSILNNGNVGIGTNNPSAPLYVQGNGASASGTIVGVQTTGNINGSGVYGLSLLPGGTGITGRADISGGGGVPVGVLGLTSATEGYAGYFQGARNYFSGNVGIGTLTPQTKLDVAGEVTTTAVNITSDRNAKEQFKPVNARDVLEKVARLPISEWQYKTQTDARHIGPMAQDFHAAFSVGRDEKHIATVDADGVALAAIQGLNEVVREQRQAMEKLEARNRELEERLAGRLEALEKLMEKTPRQEQP